MYCRNCGNTMDPNAAICVTCGCAAGTGLTYCPNCGSPTMPGASVCTSCGVALNAAHTVNHPDAKNKWVAGILGLFLGCLGVHNFYLGYTGKGIAQLLVSTIGGFISCGVATFAIAVWVLIESIMILCGNTKTDARGIPLKE